MSMTSKGEEKSMKQHIASIFQKRRSSLTDIGMPSLSVHRIMDRAPYIVLEDTPVARFYPIFTGTGTQSIVVVSLQGEFRGIITRSSLISQSRDAHRPEDLRTRVDPVKMHSSFALPAVDVDHENADSTAPKSPKAKKEEGRSRSFSDAEADPELIAAENSDLRAQIAELEKNLGISWCDSPVNKVTREASERTENHNVAHAMTGESQRTEGYNVAQAMTGESQRTEGHNVAQAMTESPNGRKAITSPRP